MFLEVWSWELLCPHLPCASRSNVVGEGVGSALVLCVSMCLGDGHRLLCVLLSLGGSELHPAIYSPSHLGWEVSGMGAVCRHGASDQ